MSSSDSSSTVPVGANSASVNPEQQVRSTTEPVKFETYYVIPQTEQADRAAAPPQMLEAGSLQSSNIFSSIQRGDNRFIKTWAMQWFRFCTSYYAHFLHTV